MAFLSDRIYQVLDQQLELVLAIDDDEVTETAKKIAYYCAMIDAANDDPFDNADEQNEMLEYLAKNLTELIEKYQELVNDKLP